MAVADLQEAVVEYFLLLLPPLLATSPSEVNTALISLLRSSHAIAASVAQALVWEQLLLYTTARPPPCKEGIKPAAYSLLAPSKLLSMNKAQPTKGLFVVVVSAFQTLQASAPALEHCRLLCTGPRIAAEKSQPTPPANGAHMAV